MKTGSGTEHAGGNESTLISEKTAFSPFTSPLQPLDDNTITSDHTMYDMLPDLNPDAMEECLNLPRYPGPMSLGDYDDYPLNFYSTSERNSLSYEGMRSSSLQEINPFTLTKMMSQQEPQKEEQHARVYAASAGSFISPSPNNRTQRPQPRSPQAAGKLHPLPTNDKSTCKCLQTILSLIEELENRACTTGGQTLDSILAYQKEALRHCIRVVHCSTCTARSDHMILLGVVSDKLITSYEHVIAGNMESFLRGMRRNNSHHNTDMGTEDEEAGAAGSGKSSSSSNGAERAGERDGGDDDVDGGGRSLRPRTVSFGCYKIDSQTEWEYVVRVLMTLQLRQVLGLLGSMQTIAEGTSRGPQIAAIRLRKQRLAAVGEKIKGRAGS